MIELVVIAAVLFLILGLAVPLVRERITTNARAQALGDLRRIAADIMTYKKDTGIWPTHCTFAYTDGANALDEDHCIGDNSNADHISTFLAVNKPPVPKWRGPYMSISRADPWEHRYVVVLEGLRSPSRPYAWILSAGPDGVFQTTKADRKIQGDDLGLLLR